MYNISDELRARFENGERKCARITLNGISDKDLIITEADILAGGFSIDRYCATGSKVEIGSAVSAELSLTLNNNDGRFNDVVFEGSILKVEIGIKGVADSYIPCGFFTVDEPPRAFSTIKLKALDFMMRFDKTVNLGDLGSNYTVETLIKKCADLCFVNISPNLNLSKLPNADKSVAIPSTVSTYRQLLQWAAQLTGTCAYIDWNGELMLSWFVDTPVKITTAHRYSGDVLESDIEITGVAIKNESVTVVSGTEEYPLVIEGNGLIIDDEEEKVGNIGNIVNGFKYRPYECSCVAMPYLYPLDKIVYVDKNGNEISTVITNHTFGLNDTSSLAAQGETAAKNSYAQQVGLTKAEVENAIAEAIKKVNHNTEYFYVRYSAYEDGKKNGVTSMTDKITADTVYLGTCATNSANAPEDADSYDWVKIRGKDAYTVLLSSEVHTFAEKTYEDVFVYIEAYKGATRIPTKITKVNGAEVSGKQTDIVEPYDGFFVQCFNNDGEATNNYANMTATDNLTTQSGVITLTIEADGQTFTKDFSFSVARNGSNGQSLQVKYKNSTSTPSITNNMSGWSDTIPAPEAGKRTYMTQKLSGATDWSAPIQISAEDGTTPTVTINSNGYWVINGGTTTVKAKGEKPTITVQNGNWYVDGVDTGEKAQGEQGKDGADIEYIYYRKTALGTPSTPTASTTIYAPTSTAYNKWTSSPCGITETYKYEYVSVRTKAAGAANWGDFSTPVIWSSWGEKGTDGDGIEYKYFIADVPGVYNYTAGDQTWTDDPTGVDKDWMYEYVVQIKHKGDGSTEISNPGTLWAKWGATGSSATAYSLISSASVIAKSATGTLSPSTITFTCKSQTGTNAPTNTSCRLLIAYTIDLSTWNDDQNLDTSSHTYSVASNVKAVRCRMYTKGGTSNLLDEITIPVVSDGADGQGKDAYTVILSNESHTFAEGSTTATKCYVLAYKGATQIATKITKINDTAITGNVTNTISGLTFATKNNGGTSTSNYVEITPSSTLSGTGTVEFTISADNSTFKKSFSYGVAAKGDDGNGVTSVTITYAKSTSGDSVPSSGWGSSVPTLSEGDYLWTKTVTTYEKTAATTSYTVSRIGANGSPGKDGQNLYAECQTDASTYNKDAILKTGSLSSINTGCTITVKFVNANTYKTPYLRVYNANSGSDITHYMSNGTKQSNCPIIWNKVSPSINNPLYWGAGTVVTMVFDGVGWVIIDVGATKMDMTSSGLVVGNYSSSGALQNNVLIGASDVQIRNDQTVYAKFGATVTIGRDTDTYNNIFIDSDSIDIRRGDTTLASMGYEEHSVFGDMFKIKAPKVLHLTSDDQIVLQRGYYKSDTDTSDVQCRLSLISNKPSFYVGTTYASGTTYNSSSFLVERNAITLNSPSIMLNNHVYLPNNVGINTYTVTEQSDGTLKSTPRFVFKVSTGNWLDIGSSFYNGDAKGTTVYGKVLQHRVYPGGTGYTYKPYYSKSTSTNGETTTYGAESVTITLHTTGYLKDAKSALYYTIPLAKPVIGSPAVAIATSQGYILYQNGNYINGSDMSKRVSTSSCNAYLAGNQDLLYVVANFSDTTNAIANTPVGIDVTVTITFT